jgi:hypothetical protein
MPCNYYPAQGIPLTPSEMHYGYQMTMNPYLNQGYYMQGMPQERYHYLLQQSPSMNLPIHGLESRGTQYTDVQLENVNPNYNYRPF